MQFYLMMFVITFVIIATMLHICERVHGFKLYEEPENLIPAYIVVLVASVFWFVVWPVTIMGAFCYLVFKSLDILFLRKYLKKDNPNA